MVGSCGINRICRPFPSAGSKMIPLLDFKHPIVIHLLPECVSLPEADLSWIARQIAAPVHTHFIASIQPLDPCASFDNLERLRGLLPGAASIASVSSQSIGFTADYRRVSLKGELWQYAPTEPVDIPEIERLPDTVAPLSGSDINMLHSLRRAGLPLSVAEFLDDISRNLSPLDRLFLSPSLPPYSADICLIRPDRGMTLLKVVMLRPSDPRFPTEVETAVEELRDMRRHLALFLPGIDGRKIVRDNIRIAVLVANALCDELPEMVLRSNALLVTPETLHTENGNTLFRSYVPIPASEQFSRQVAIEALKLLCPPFHRKLMGKPLTPDAGQLEAITNDDVENVIGASGSGKTTCMLLRAIRLSCNGDKKVLIVVPDATAIHALRHKLRRLYADVNPADLHICAFADLMRIRRPAPRLQFRHILIDDAHCLSPQETDLLKSRFLLPDGRLCKFSNPLTDLYRRPETDTADCIHLTQAYSSATKNLKGILSRILIKLAPDLPHTGGENTPGRFSQTTLPSAPPDALGIAIHNIIASSPYDAKDTMIVSENNALLRELADILKDRLGYPCQTTFATSSDIERLRHSVRNPAGAISLHEDSLRHRFDPAADRLKLTSSRHLESIEIPHIILLFSLNENPDYRALYRTATAVTDHLTLCILK